MNRASKMDHYRQYEAQRAMHPERVAARKSYAMTAEGRDAHARACRTYASRFPQRRNAQVIASNAIRTGRLIPWPVCAVHTCNDKPEAHHPDYDQPLSVVWLCCAHHRAAHRIGA
jgi:hypothetical protein